MEKNGTQDYNSNTKEWIEKSDGVKSKIISMLEGVTVYQIKLQ